MTARPTRILVVDDEKLVRWAISNRLQRDGYDVLSADSAEQALELIASNAPDLMLLDVCLPGIDGTACLQHALALHPDVTVVMMSAHSTVDVAVEAMKLGAIDFLVKPFPLQSLDVAVERALAATRMRRQISALTSERKSRNSALEALVGGSRAMEVVRSMAARLAWSAATTVLIEGESGAGKDLVARAIHFESSRADNPFLQVNCTALPEHLLESELFGHERGAFTDAHAQKRGLFEVAEGGSVMLDEVGDLAPSGQAKLLRLLENKVFRRVGGVQELKADVRVLAATNADLETRVAEGRFRADLFFRLNVIRVVVPPLRQHPDDIPQLIEHLIERFNRELKQHVTRVSPAALKVLSAHAWPGNIRQLRNVMERAFILHPGVDEIRLEHLPPEVQLATPPKGESVPVASDEGLALRTVERKLVAEAMERTHGNQSRAARLLGVSRDTLRYRLRKHGME